jgi:hypothetical protein
LPKSAAVEPLARDCLSSSRPRASNNRPNASTMCSCTGMPVRGHAAANRSARRNQPPAAEKSTAARSCVKISVATEHKLTFRGRSTDKPDALRIITRFQMLNMAVMGTFCGTARLRPTVASAVAKETSAPLIAATRTPAASTS